MFLLIAFINVIVRVSVIVAPVSSIIDIVDVAVTGNKLKWIYFWVIVIYYH